MKIKTSELTGAQLDWAVAKAEYIDRRVEVSPYGGVYFEHAPGTGDSYNMGWTYARFSTDWAQAGPIIEREGILLNVDLGAKKQIKYWWADNVRYDNDCYQEGPTPLVAAMRCFVESKLGNEVEVPEELK